MIKKNNIIIGIKYLSICDFKILNLFVSFYRKMEEIIIDYNNSNDEKDLKNNNNEQNSLLVENNNESNILLEENNNLNTISYCPSIEENIIENLNEIFVKAKSSKRKRALLGVIKFIHNGREYIHCPIKKVRKEGEIVKFGVCKHTDSFLNTAENRKKLSAHKFQYHYLSKRPNSNTVNLHFKTTKSLEEIIEKIKNKKKSKILKKPREECLKCINCKCVETNN